MVITKNTPPESNDFITFLERIGGRITDDTWHSMKIHLRSKINLLWLSVHLYMTLIKYQFNHLYIHCIYDNNAFDICIADCSLCFSFKEFVDHKRVEKMNPSIMLKELSEMFKLQYNMSFLEWIFDKCGKPKLVRDCQQYSAENQFQLECFNTNFTPSK